MPRGLPNVSKMPPIWRKHVTSRDHILTIFCFLTNTMTTTKWTRVVRYVIALPFQVLKEFYSLNKQEGVGYTPLITDQLAATSSTTL